MSEAQETIQIQCPACKTKFNLSAHALNTVSNPKFHCSKCDHIFEVKNVNDNFSEDFNEVVSNDTLDEIAEESVKEEQHSADELEETENNPLIDNTDEKFLNSFPDATAEEEVDVKGKKTVEINVNVNEIEEDMQHYQSEQLELDDYYKKRAEEMEKKREEKANSMQLALAKEVSFLQSLKFLTPLVLVLIILFGLSFFLTQYPGDAKKTMAKVIGKTENVAPVKLMISNVKASSIILDSGETTFIIEGTVINGTDSNFSEVVLEATAFDSRGKKLKSQKAYLNSSLGKTRVTALNPRMIKTLQSRKPIKRVELKPGERTKFVIALLDDQFDADIIKRAKHYVARIYSVI